MLSAGSREPGCPFLRAVMHRLLLACPPLGLCTQEALMGFLPSLEEEPLSFILQEQEAGGG